MSTVYSRSGLVCQRLRVAVCSRMAQTLFPSQWALHAACVPCSAWPPACMDGGWASLLDDCGPEPARDGWAELLAADAGQPARDGWAELLAADGGDTASEGHRSEAPTAALKDISIELHVAPRQGRGRPRTTQAPALNDINVELHVAPGQGRELANVRAAKQKRRQQQLTDHLSLKRRHLPQVPTIDLAAVVLDQKAPFVASPIISHLAACAGIASELPDEELDPDALSLAKVYLSGPRSFHGCSDVGLAGRLNMGNSRVPRLVSRLGSAITLLDRADQASVEKAWSLVSGCELLEYIDGNRYDETPLGMRVREELLRESGNSRVDECIESQLLPDQRQQLSLVGARVPQAAGSSGTKLKVMQTESSYTLLVKLMRDGSSSYLMVRGGSATWLQAAD